MAMNLAVAMVRQPCTKSCGAVAFFQINPDTHCLASSLISKRDDSPMVVRNEDNPEI